jgi:hypothetical protein
MRPEGFHGGVKFGHSNYAAFFECSNEVSRQMKPQPSGSRGLRPPPENFSRKKGGYSSLTHQRGPRPRPPAHSIEPMGAGCIENALNGIAVPGDDRMNILPRDQ